MYSIKKEYKFEYAHRLMEHKGDCKNIHGHSARIEIELFNKDINIHGMIVDFGHLGFISSYFDENYDHTLILNSVDPLCELLMTNQICNDFKIQKFQGEPTAENFAATMAYDILNIINNKNLDIQTPMIYVQSIKVTFWETSKNCATFQTENLV